MKDLKDRLKTVQELLNSAEFIRKKAGSAQASEASDWEQQLIARRAELLAKIEEAKMEEKTAVAHAHA